MIENIHSHEGEEQDKKKINYTFKPPKNIKQIGESTSLKKIYVEDYVFTYIKELVKKEYASCRITVLLGHYVKTQEARIILINGAVEAEGIQYDAESVFNNDTWTSVYENIKRYFTDVEVVGWCIGAPGFILENDEKLKKIHLDNFAGVDKALLKYDSMEGEEAFYIYENGALSKQNGYYIYYDKNDDMQNYIMEHKAMKPRTAKETQEIAMKEYKEEMKEQRVQENNKSIMHLMYAAGSLMVVLVIIVFASMINNSNRIDDLEKSMNHLSTTLNASLNRSEQEDSALDASTNTGKSMDVETISGNLNSIKNEEVIGDKADNTSSTDETAKGEDTATNQSEDPKEGKTPSESGKDQEESTAQGESKDNSENQEGTKGSSDETATNKSEETKVESNETDSSKKNDDTTTKADDSNTKETSSGSTEVKYYEVQKGDTLVAISFKLYNSGDYVSKIMELNGIEDMDMIYYGQKLIVP